MYVSRSCISKDHVAQDPVLAYAYRVWLASRCYAGSLSMNDFCKMQHSRLSYAAMEVNVLTSYDVRLPQLSCRYVSNPALGPCRMFKAQQGMQRVQTELESQLIRAIQGHAFQPPDAQYAFALAQGSSRHYHQVAALSISPFSSDLHPTIRFYESMSTQ